MISEASPSSNLLKILSDKPSAGTEVATGVCAGAESVEKSAFSTLAAPAVVLSADSSIVNDVASSCFAVGTAAASVFRTPASLPVVTASVKAAVRGDSAALEGLSPAGGFGVGEAELLSAITVLNDEGRWRKV